MHAGGTLWCVEGGKVRVTFMCRLTEHAMTEVLAYVSCQAIKAMSSLIMEGSMDYFNLVTCYSTYIRIPGHHHDRVLLLQIVEFILGLDVPKRKFESSPPSNSFLPPQGRSGQGKQGGWDEAFQKRRAVGGFIVYTWEIAIIMPVIIDLQWIFL